MLEYLPTSKRFIIRKAFNNQQETPNIHSNDDIVSTFVYTLPVEDLLMRHQREGLTLLIQHNLGGQLLVLLIQLLTQLLIQLFLVLLIQLFLQLLMFGHCFWIGYAHVAIILLVVAGDDGHVGPVEGDDVLHCEFQDGLKIAGQSCQQGEFGVG